MNKKILKIYNKLYFLLEQMEEKDAQVFLQSFQLLIANSNIENVLLSWQKSLCEMPLFELENTFTYLLLWIELSRSICFSKRFNK